ncbi:hypothetical protein NC653_031942 [Populus alba x Populus x berolinensis]|uniref:Uncharacterized protein n=2 Tax=Populus TaxID=3689 RepID=A0A4U5QKY8_POPAL|nr:hypothetical protein NC653_031942 [Populus alba x Populus x berolinensis]TKS10921.1 hypothetical protein D5086_0000078260 [Populus alba]
MANKKKKSVYHKSHLKQQASHLINDCINDCIIRALEAPSLSRSVHVTVPSNSNSPHNAPSILPNQSSCPFPQLISTNHSPAPQDPSPSINHIFVHDYSDGEELDEDVDLNSSGEDYVGGSKFFISSVWAASANNPQALSIPVVCPTKKISPPVASPVLAASPTAVSPSCASSAPIASPVCAPACAASPTAASPLFAATAPVDSPVCAASPPVVCPTSAIPPPVTSPVCATSPTAA